MKHYIDITLLPDSEIGHNFLWGKVYQQLHLALVENKNAKGLSPFGVTFPEFNVEKQRLGRKLRVFSPVQTSMEKLNLPRWLAKLNDYVHITSPRDVPDNVKDFVRFYRLHTKSSVERLARRAALRHSQSFEQAMEERKNLNPELTDAPFVQMQSHGNNNRFRLFIAMEQIEETYTDNQSFSTYGLSKKGVLPMI